LAGYPRTPERKVLLNWDDEECLDLYPAGFEEQLPGERQKMVVGLEVSDGGAGVVSHT
jgi:hypothetical protein